LKTHDCIGSRISEQTATTNKQTKKEVDAWIFPVKKVQEQSVIPVGDTIVDGFLVIF
jgi:hypothetical protein